MDTSLFNRLDHEIRQVRQRLEERRHLANLQKEAVNDIRRYRHRARRAATPPDTTARLARRMARVDARVLEGVLAARDALRQEVVAGAPLESTWSDLVAERERRLAPLPRPLLDRLGEVEERLGILAAQMKVAERVLVAGDAARDALSSVGSAYPHLGDEEVLVEVVGVAQLALLALRREAKHLHGDAGRLETELQALLGFSDRLLHAMIAEGPDTESPSQVLHDVEQMVDRLLESARRLLDARRRTMGLLETQVDAVTVPS